MKAQLIFASKLSKKGSQY
jgi:PAS domain S-box-containing protein